MLIDTNKRVLVRKSYFSSLFHLRVHARSEERFLKIDNLLSTFTSASMQLSGIVIRDIFAGFSSTYA
jgi:hypothetical protein